MKKWRVPRPSASGATVPKTRSYRASCAPCTPTGPQASEASGVNWLFRHGFALVLKHLDLPLPVVARSEPREVDRKDRVLPAPREPGAVVNEAQRAQRFDER